MLFLPFAMQFINISIFMFQKPDRRSQTPQLSDGSNEKLNNLQQELEQSRKEVTTMKKEHEEYRLEKAKNDKLIKDDYDNLRKTMEKTR